MVFVTKLGIIYDISKKHRLKKVAFYFRFNSNLLIYNMPKIALKEQIINIVILLILFSPRTWMERVIFMGFFRTALRWEL